MHIHTCVNYPKRPGIPVGFHSTLFHVDKPGNGEHEGCPAGTQCSADRHRAPGKQLPNSES